MIKIIKIGKDADIRLDKFLKLKFTSLTQSYIEKNIRKKNILINNIKTSAKYIVRCKDILKILNFKEDIFKNKITFNRKVNIPRSVLAKFNKSIIFQNNEFLILNKWSSLSTQGGTKINISVDDIIKEISTEYKLVHRLDKETSGLLIISKNKKSAKIFGYLFKSQLINKIYLAICEGRPNILETTINLDIKNKIDKIERTRSFYKVLNSKDGMSLILFKPITGKTHQLRIVSKKINCPIVGDLKYNKHSKFKKEILKLNAHILSFTFNDKNYEFYSEIPTDFINFLKKYKLKFLNKMIN